MTLDIQIHADKQRPAPRALNFTAADHRIYNANDPDCHSATATVNGVDVSEWCTAACPGEGWVDMVVLDDEGHVQADEQDNVVIKRDYGVVVVKLEGA